MSSINIDTIAMPCIELNLLVCQTSIDGLDVHRYKSLDTSTTFILYFYVIDLFFINYCTNNKSPLRVCLVNVVLSSLKHGLYYFAYGACIRNSIDCSITYAEDLCLKTITNTSHKQYFTTNKAYSPSTSN